MDWTGLYRARGVTREEEGLRVRVFDVTGYIQNSSAVHIPHATGFFSLLAPHSLLKCLPGSPLQSQPILH